MNTHQGYSKKKLDNTLVLLAGGGDKSLADFLGGIRISSSKIQYKTADVSASWTDLITLVNTDENVKQTPKTDNVNRPLMMINGGTTTGELTNTSIFSTGIYANAYTKMIIANGFVKAGSDSSHVLLGDGSHKALSDFAMASDYVKKTGDTMSGPLTIDNKLYVNKGINVRERSYFNGGVEFNYPLYIHDTLYVYDNSIFEGSATFNNPTYHNNTGYFDSGINVSSHSYFNSGVDFYESININHKAHIYDYIDYPISNSNNKTINTILFTATDNDYVRKMSFSTFGAKLRDSGFLDSRYVSAVTISGIHLRVTKNGSNTDLTIPYAINTDTVDGLHASNLVKLYSYSIPASKGVRITFSPHNSCIINCSKGNNGGQLVLIGTGYGVEGTIRNRFTELVSCNESHFLWSLPQVSDISTSVEIMHVSISGSAATVYVHSSGTVTFTEISELTSPKMNNTLLNSLNYTNYTVKKDGTGASGTWRININGIATNANYINTISTESSSNHYLTFVDSNNSSAAYEALYTNSDLYYKPNSHKLYINKLHTSSEIEVNGTARLYNDVKCSASFEVQGTSRIKGELYVTSTAHFQANIDAYDIYPHTKNTYDLGTPNKYWKELFVGGVSDSGGSGHIWYGKNWGSGKEYNFGIDGLILYLDVDETSGIQFNGDYINMWSPCDDDYSLRYWDADSGDEAWHIDTDGHFSGSAAELTTARTLWGQSFNGTANVSGSMSSVGNISFLTSGKNIGGILYFDTTNSRLGVSTSTPFHKLDVVGDIFTTVGFIKQNSSNLYVLLGGGGHKLESSLNVNYANYSGYSNTVLGSYTGNGGKLNPNYFGNNRVGFLMMNTTVNNNSLYKDWMIMDCYSGNDVGGGVAIGINRLSLGAYIMRSAATRTSWAESAELIGTHNYTTYCATSGHNHDGLYVNVTGDTMTGTLAFTDNIGISGLMGGGSDNWGIVGSGTGDAGRLKIYVGDNGTSDWLDFEFRDYGGTIYTPLSMTGNLVVFNYNPTVSGNALIHAGNIGDHLPIGTVIMWATASIPAKWLICDGRSVPTDSPLRSLMTTTPNLSGRFPLGVSNSYGLGSIGGEATHTLTTNEMPRHKHSFDNIIYSEHHNDVSQGNADGIYGYDYQDESLVDGSEGNVPGGRNDLGLPGQNSDTDYDNDTFPYMTMDTAISGGGQAHNNMPPYRTLYFIIKAY